MKEVFNKWSPTKLTEHKQAAMTIKKGRREIAGVSRYECVTFIIEHTRK